MNDSKTGNIDNLVIDELVRTKRKTLALIVKPDASLVVRAPIFTSMSRIMDFVNKNQSWIKRRQEKIKSEPISEKFFPKILNPKIIKEYKKEAKEKISQRLDYYSNLTGLKYKSIKITSARTRWGSCGPRGNLCFTWRLVRAPLEVIDYVVVHELVHIVQRDHSKKFWNRVEAIIPDYKKNRIWLRKIGKDLLL
jgi:predicted metal-dependent hydrolase